jgi:hypothetical protein
MTPTTEQIEFADGTQWHKTVLPVDRNWVLFGLFSLCLLIWLGMLAGIVGSMITQGFGFLLNIMLFIWLIVWLWFGRVLWRRWQYYAASREILFINERQLLVRRPVSILGSTDVYDMGHVTPFYFSENHQCPAFDYAYQHVYFGQSLLPSDAQELVTMLNDRFFPDADLE